MLLLVVVVQEVLVCLHTALVQQAAVVEAADIAVVLVWL
jgi:hypothetical protein